MKDAAKKGILDTCIHCNPLPTRLPEPCTAFHTHIASWGIDFQNQSMFYFITKAQAHRKQKGRTDPVLVAPTLVGSGEGITEASLSPACRRLTRTQDLLAQWGDFNHCTRPVLHTVNKGKTKKISKTHGWATFTVFQTKKKSWSIQLTLEHSTPILFDWPAAC